MTIIDNDVLPRYNFLIIAIIFLNTSSQRIGTKKREAYNLMFVFFLFVFSILQFLAHPYTYLGLFICPRVYARIVRHVHVHTHSDIYIYTRTRIGTSILTHSATNALEIRRRYFSFSLSLPLPLFFSFSPNFLLSKTVVLIHSSVKTTAIYLIISPFPHTHAHTYPATLLSSPCNAFCNGGPSKYRSLENVIKRFQ